MRYALKFLWAPLIDSYALPFLGLRRGWAVVCQVGLFVATVDKRRPQKFQRIGHTDQRKFSDRADINMRLSQPMQIL